MAAVRTYTDEIAVAMGDVALVTVGFNVVAAIVAVSGYLEHSPVFLIRICSGLVMYDSKKNIHGFCSGSIQLF